MNRFATRYWLQDWPLSVQLWACLSLAEGLTLAAILLYVLLLLRPEEPGQWYGLAALFPLLLIANLFAAKLAARRITEPLERLAGNLERIKGKNWSEPVLQVARRDEIGTLVNTLSQIQRNVVELNEDEEFCYQSVSHGLKTPIMVIQNCCAAYQDGIYGSEAIDIIMKESLAVEAGIRKLLYVSSFDHMLGKQSDFRPVELRGLMEECRRRFRGNERGIRLEVDVPAGLTVSGNAAALQTVFDNLVENGLRSRVVVETDGKLMSGRDVAIACMLGAEEFGFATAPLVALGCCMMRVCNLDTCPAGIATQNPQLRSRFSGKPEYVVNFMEFVAQELREYMAALGIRTVDELVGRSDLLRVREKLVTHRAETLDLRSLLENPWSGGPSHFNPGDVYDFHLERTLDESVLLAKLGKTLKGKRTGRLELTVSSTDRAFGTLFGAEITRQCGDSLPDDSYVITCHGGGGQSFGAFIPKGLTLELEGDCNDGLGKGLSGGKLVLYPPKDSTFDPGENIIVGNVALYGATSGQAFINGMAGERFCVRNSGAIAVVEGVGDHGCEYMTGGRCVILGPTGKNFAAGMSGGIAYVLDEKHDLYMRLNKDQVMTDTLTEPHDIAELRSLIEAHVAATGSPRGKKILAAFHSYVPCFKKVMPRDYDRMLRSIAQYEEKGMTRQQAEIEAFYANTRA